jgi:hypothetical protein
MSSTAYRRSPLPKSAQAPLGWLAICVAGVIFSPFVGFSVHGTVDNTGLIVGLAFSVLPFTGLVAIAAIRWYAWRRLPTRLAEEWTAGKIVPAEGAPSVLLPVQFSDLKNRVEIWPDGVVLSRATILAILGFPGAASQKWISEQVGELFVPWKDIAEWVVETDSDAPDYYELKLHPRGKIRVQRFKPFAGNECDLLDAVRSAGNLPIRLRCDVTCDESAEPGAFL